MVKFNAEMYIDKIGERGQYDQKIMLRADLNDADVKYPQHIEVVLKQKKFDLLPDDLIPGDKISVDLYPNTKTGVSKTTGKPWTITELIVMKLAVTERLPRNGEVADDTNYPEECPF